MNPENEQMNPDDAKASLGVTNLVDQILASQNPEMPQEQEQKPLREQYASHQGNDMEEVKNELKEIKDEIKTLLQEEQQDNAEENQPTSEAETTATAE